MENNNNSEKEALKAKFRAEILAKTDKERTDTWGSLFSMAATREPHEVADYAYVVPDLEKFEVQFSKTKIIFGGLLALALTALALNGDGFSLLIIAIAIIGVFGTLAWNYKHEPRHLILTKKGIEMGHSPFVPWEDVLTLQFSDNSRKVNKNKLILRYFVNDTWKMEEISIAHINFTRGQLAAIILKLMRG
jgi:hypothetical protein